MGGKSRKMGSVSRKLIERIKSSTKIKSNIVEKSKSDSFSFFDGENDGTKSVSERTRKE